MVVLEYVEKHPIDVIVFCKIPLDHSWQILFVYYSININLFICLPGAPVNSDEGPPT